MKTRDKYEKIAELAKRRGFFWPSYEIYGGVGGLIDFGHLGATLKHKIEAKWRDEFVRQQGLIEIETPVVGIGKVFEASGHAKHFTDKMVECQKCKRKWRVDHVIQEQTRIKGVEGLSLEELDKIIAEKNIRCPECKGKLGKTQHFNLMFKTSIGPYADSIDYGRPEAAQSMFTNFKRLYEMAREKLPFGVAQIGRCLRNEISPRQGPIRLREFTIMEFEFFFDPEEPHCPKLKEVEKEVLAILPASEKMKKVEKTMDLTVGEALSRGFIKAEWQAYFMAVSKQFVTSLGIPSEKQRFDEKLPWEKAHYSAQTYDHEVYCERWGWIEVAGHAYRTDYDLKTHMEKSRVDMQIFKAGRRFIPHVVEPSFGAERLVYATLEYAYTKKDDRIILKFPIDIVPIQLAVFPLVSKDGLQEKAMEVYTMLMGEGFTVEYDEAGSIGKRYARADEAGVPIAITIDYTTLKDGTVTLRDRDSWMQVRNKIDNLPEILHKYFKGKLKFKQIGA